MELIVHEKEYRIHVYETGPDGHLNLHSLFNYLQDIASDHAIRLGFGRDDLLRANRFWVLSRIYAEIGEMPVWEDAILVRTWPNGTDRLFALRNFEVTFTDGRPIALATSSWLILDRATKKVQRPDETLSRFYSDLIPNKSPLRYPGKLEFENKGDQEQQPYKIKVSDLDINLHTNNVKYLNWVTDCYDLDFTMKNHPWSAEINYLAESQFGEDVEILTAGNQNEDKDFNHSIRRISDNRELCRVRIVWKESDNS
jgi:medium-chain acyl-[acyl-carrier-protein] hydrolase